MKSLLALIILLLTASVGRTDDLLVGNSIEHSDNIGYYINIWDHRKETLRFMESSQLQGGGPTWKAITRAALEINSPKTLKSLQFDDESDVVLVISKSKTDIETVHSLVKKAMDDISFRQECIEHAKKKGYLE